MEVEAEARLAPGLVLTGQASLTDARYLSYPNGPCPLEKTGSSATACDLSGRRLPGVPDWAWSATADYSRPLAGRDLETFARADASGRGDSAGEATGSAYTQIGGYTLVNLSAGLRRPGSWEVSAWVRNAFDARWLTAVTVQAGNSGLVLGAPGDPRLAGLTLRVAY